MLNSRTLKMKKIIIITVLSCLLILIAFSIYKFLGYSYYRPALWGSEYIEDSDELYYINQLGEQKFLLKKKYLYSNSTWSIIGRGNMVVHDYYGIGVCTSNKKELIPAIYKNLYALYDPKLEITYIEAHHFIQDGIEVIDHFMVIDGALVQVENKDAM